MAGIANLTFCPRQVRLGERVAQSNTTLKEALEKHNTTETEQRSYPKTRADLVEARQKLEESLQASNEKENTDKIHETKRQMQELERILVALDSGDVRPAQDMLLSQIEANISSMRTERELRKAGVDIEKELEKRGIDPHVESYGRTIANIAEQLTELESPKRSNSDHDSNEPSRERMETSSLERAINELNASETQLRKTLAAVTAEKNRLRDHVKQINLDAIKKSI